MIKLILLTSTLLISTTANSALVSRLGGLAYYDTEADLTWLADANYAMTSGYDADGLMTWDETNTWAAGLIVDGVDGWRLADTLQPDAGCSHTDANGQNFGFNCTGSEMGNLFYNVLGGVAVSSITTTHNANYDLFSNVVSSVYWSSTEYAPNTNSAWHFNMISGDQNYNFMTGANYAWAVHDGDVSEVPIPASIWLFISGLIGIARLLRK